MITPPAAITSRRSPRIQAMRRLHEAADRRAAGRILVEGPDGLAAAIAAGVPVLEVLVTGQGRARASNVVKQAEGAGALIVDVTDQVMEAVAQTRSPQGIVACCQWRPAPIAEAIMPGVSCLVLDRVSDPGNVGTIIRSSDAVGLGGVVLTEGCVDPGNGKCIRASAGSIFHLPISFADSATAVLAQARRAGHRVVVVTAEGRQDLFTWIRDTGVGEPLCWVLGSEAHGVGEVMRAGCDVEVRIPMTGRAESLNVAAAAAVCLYAGRLAHMED